MQCILSSHLSLLLRLLSKNYICIDKFCTFNLSSKNSISLCCQNNMNYLSNSTGLWYSFPRKKFFSYFFSLNGMLGGAVVVYFDQLSGAVCTWKLVKPFFQPFFNLFCSFQSLFSDFTAEINKKRLKMNQKNVVLSTPQSWLTCKSWSTPWGGT